MLHITCIKPTCAGFEFRNTELETQEHFMSNFSQFSMLLDDSYPKIFISLVNFFLQPMRPAMCINSLLNEDGGKIQSDFS